MRIPESYQLRPQRGDLGGRAEAEGRPTARVHSDNARPPLVAHVIYRLDVGGLENGLVNIINRMPPDRYRHAVICLTTFSDFRKRIQRPDVEVFALHKRPGKDLGMYLKLWRLLRALRPAIVHTRNLAALDAAVVAALAGVPVRIHGEHGRDVVDLDGSNRKYQLLRRVCAPFVRRFVPMSKDLEDWLRRRVGIDRDKVLQIYNGVDAERFRPAPRRVPLPVAGFAPPGTMVIGGVGRMEPVKDPMTLVGAFLHLLRSVPNGRQRLRLVLVGDGPLRAEVEATLAAAGAEDLVWLAGARDDVPEIMRGFDVFALPSLAEGVSNTILEAMATGLPVVATRVGGTPELVTDGANGTMVPPADPEAMAAALGQYLNDSALGPRQGSAGRARVEREFSLDRMVEQYMAVYDAALSE